MHLTGMQRWWTVLAGSSSQMTQLILQYRKILWATTRIELAKRYAGSSLGLAWVFLYPSLLLCVYLFVYMVVFRVRFPGFSQWEYVLYIFCGLVPYFGFVEAANSGCVSIKQNIHLIKNVMMPIELIPVRVVLVSVATQMVSTGILILLITGTGLLSLHLVWLPVVVVLQLLALGGLIWVLAAIGIAFPDVGYFVNLFTLLLLFISPIGFTPDMIPDGFAFMVYLNPIHYMIEMFRASLLYGSVPSAGVLIPYVSMCVGSYVIGSTFFLRFKDHLADYE